MLTTLLLILIITIILFVWGKFPPDVVALIAMLSLFLFGILDLNETLSGFSNPTVIMIASLFVIGEGLSNTGWTALAGKKFMELAGKSVSKLLIIITFGSGRLPVKGRGTFNNEKASGHRTKLLYILTCSCILNAHVDGTGHF